MSAAGVAADEMVKSLSATIDQALENQLPYGEPCALVDFPLHGNVGDHAIWLGQREALGRTGHKVVYACGPSTWRRQEMAAALQGATILLSGGGSLGDLWPLHQRLREEVIAAFPRSRIVQLPQSIEFRDRRNLERARGVFDAHPDLTLLVRDRRSLEIAASQFRAPARLCPDMAFALGPLPRVGQPRHDVVWLAREDQERPQRSPLLDGLDVERTDWVSNPPAESLPPQLELYDALATAHLERGRRLLSRGDVVLTDRLHGHILSVLMGIPNVVLDNSYGKVRGFYGSWTDRCAIARLVEPDDDVTTALDELRPVRSFRDNLGT